MNFFLTLLTSCVIATSPTTTDIDNYISCRDTANKIETVLYWQPLIEKYFKQEDVKRSLLIIYCESRGKSTAVGRNTNGTTDVGLWQFNDDTWEWLKPKLKITSTRFNPEVSTAVASWLVYNDGWYHWNASKHCWGK
jgi:hypothetical protein